MSGCAGIRRAEESATESSHRRKEGCLISGQRAFLVGAEWVGIGNRKKSWIPDASEPGGGEKVEF